MALRSAAFLIDALDEDGAEFVRTCLLHVANVAALADRPDSRSSDKVQLGLYSVEQVEVMGASAAASYGSGPGASSVDPRGAAPARRGSVQLRVLAKPSAGNLREWYAAVARLSGKSEASGGNAGGGGPSETQRIALCLRSLIPLLSAEAATAAHQVVHVVAQDFRPTPQLQRIIQDLAALSIHVSFTLLAQAQLQGPASAAAAAAAPLSPEPPTAGSVVSLRWKAGGASLDLSPGMAAFMAQMGEHDNVQTFICTTDLLACERQSMLWLQQLLPPPQLLCITLHWPQPGPPQHSLGPQHGPPLTLNQQPGLPGDAALAPKAAGPTASDPASDPERTHAADGHEPSAERLGLPPAALRFHVASQILNLNVQIRRPAVCPCHGVPVVEPAAATGDAAQGQCSITRAPVTPMPDPAVLGIGAHHSLRLADPPRHLPGAPPLGPPLRGGQEGPQPLPRVPGDAGTAGASGSVDLRIERVVQVASLSESLSYGWPHLLFPSSADFDNDKEASANCRSVSALATVLREAGAALLVSSCTDLDTAAPTLCRQWYSMVPSSTGPRPTRPAALGQEEGSCGPAHGDAQGQPEEKGLGGAAGPVPSFLVKHVACRETILPLPAASSSTPSAQRARAEDCAAARVALALLPGMAASGCRAGTLGEQVPDTESAPPSSLTAEAGTAPDPPQATELPTTPGSGSCDGAEGRLAAVGVPSFSPLDISSGVHERIQELVKGSVKAPAAGPGQQAVPAVQPQPPAQQARARAHVQAQLLPGAQASSLSQAQQHQSQQQQQQQQQQHVQAQARAQAQQQQQQRQQGARPK